MSGTIGMVFVVLISIACVVWVFSDSELVLSQSRISSIQLFSVAMFVDGFGKLQYICKSTYDHHDHQHRYGSEYQGSYQICPIGEICIY